MCSVVYLG